MTYLEQLRERAEEGVSNLPPSDPLPPCPECGEFPTEVSVSWPGAYVVDQEVPMGHAVITIKPCGHVVTERPTP